MKRYIAAGLLVLIGILVVTFPAQVAYRWFAPADLVLSGISGSVWRGTAAEGVAGGAYMRDVSWQLRPAEIFTGKLAFEASASPASGTMDADVAVSLDGSLSLSALSGTVPLDLVHSAFQQNGISGDVDLRFDSVVIKNGLPEEAIGTIQVRNLFAANLSAAALGDYQAVFTTNNGVVSAVVEDQSGVLDVSGILELAADGSYSLVGDVAALRGAPPSIEQQLRFLGSPDEYGKRQFRFEGQL